MENKIEDFKVGEIVKVQSYFCEVLKVDTNDDTLFLHFQNYDDEKEPIRYLSLTRLSWSPKNFGTWREGITYDFRMQFTGTREELFDQFFSYASLDFVTKMGSLKEIEGEIKKEIYG